MSFLPVEAPRLRAIDLPLAERTVPALLARRAREAGRQPLLRFEDQCTSYAQADRLTNAVANGLRAASIGRGEHVAVLLDNAPETLWTYLALGKLGAVAVPINTAARGTLLAAQLAQAACVALVTESALLARVRELPGSDTLRCIVLTDRTQDDAQALCGASLRAVGWDTVCASSDASPDAQVRCSDPLALMYTSGTTGPSKGSISPHGYAVTYGLQRAEAFGYQASDVLYTGCRCFMAMRSSVPASPRWRLARASR